MRRPRLLVWLGLLGAVEGCVRAIPGAGRSFRSGLGASLHSFGSGEHLFCAVALRGLRAIHLLWAGIVDVTLLLVEEELVLVARALSVVEGVLARCLALLSACSLCLSSHHVGRLAGVQVGVELRLLMVERLLTAIDDRLLTIADRLLQAGDPLVGVEFVL